MTEHPAANAQTPIVIRASDADRVTNLAIAAEDRLPQVAALLLRELNRAEVIPDAEMPADIVTMQATVKFIDEASGVERTLQLVYPTEADFDAGRISILSLVGAGLLGLKAGQSIMWPDRAGKERPLRIIDVMQGWASDWIASATCRSARAKCRIETGSIVFVMAFNSVRSSQEMQC